MDPVRNPYAPGAGQRPPELAGRDAELTAFDVALERVERGRPERSLVLTGLRGVGKTVLLNALRSKALDRGWGTGKVEAGPTRASAVRSLGPCTQQCASFRCVIEHRIGCVEVLATLKAFGLRTNPRGGKLIERWTPAIDGPASAGRADSGDMEIDLLELLTDVAGLAADVGVGVAVFIDEMQDLTPRTSRRSARAATSCPRPARRSWWSAPGCRICPACCQPRSRTPSGCSDMSELTAWTPPG